MKILFQGDSITDGNRYKEIESRWDKNHQIGHAYPYIVTGLFSMKYPQLCLEFVNRGISGNRTNELLLRWDEDTLKEKADVLILLVGVNDAFCNYENKEYDEDASLYKENLQRLISSARDGNEKLKIILLEPFANVDIASLSENISKDFRKRKLKNIQTAVKELANKNGTALICLQEKFDKIKDTPYPKYWLWDGVHPTEAGHALIAKEVSVELNKILNTEVNF